MKTRSDLDLYPAGIIRRIVAFIIDSLMSFIPVLVVLLFFTDNYQGYALTAPAFHATPLVGVVTLLDIPGEVNESINTHNNDIGGTYTDYDVSVLATGKRALSVLVVIFYVLYGTFATCIFEGHTFGKFLMKIDVVAVDTEKPMKKLLLRELVGKVLINSIPIVPIISLFTIIFTPKHLAIHDMIFNTRVAELTDSQK
ncbi:MAG: RDD family protein [Lachnospiraceae bacterium]|nr:RDD family protein [Lachnospiraceae bacterium]